MQALWYSLNVTADGCCDHRTIPAGEESHRHAVEKLKQASGKGLLLDGVTPPLGLIDQYEFVGQWP